jgi:hypothetical protein
VQTLAGHFQEALVVRPLAALAAFQEQLVVRP